MAVRNILHRNKLDDFINWLGDRSLPTIGEWEVARWRGTQGKPMRIVYDNSKSPEHFYCNDAAYSDVRKYIKERNSSKNIESTETDTQQRKGVIFSNRICDYCQGCPSGIDGNCLEYDRFVGKKLTPIS